MNRLDYQIKWAIGKILNIGCGDNPIDFGSSATNIDIDWWNVPNFIHCDCHDLPFNDKSFDTAVLGDVLEHCLDPIKALKEAVRVSRRLVLTIPEEVSLPSVGQHIQQGIHDRAAVYRVQHNLPDNMTNDQVITYHKQTDPRFIKAMPESVMPHDGHINRFDEAGIQDLINQTRMKIIDYRKEQEGFSPNTWMNWLVTLED